MICLDTCPFHAIETVLFNGHNISQVNEIICKGCGTCVAACPSGAASQLGFTNQQIMSEITAILAQNHIVEMEI